MPPLDACPEGLQGRMTFCCFVPIVGLRQARYAVDPHWTLAGGMTPKLLIRVAALIVRFDKIHDKCWFLLLVRHG